MTRPRPGIREVFRKRCVIAVPVLDRAVLGLQKAEETAVGTVAQHVAAGFDRVARRNVFLGHADALQTVAACRLERPDLRFAALGILHLEVNPRMRQKEVDFLYRSRDVGE